MHAPAAALFKMATFSKAHIRALLTLLVGLYLINGAIYLRYQTLTSDEAAFYNYAVRFLKGQPDRIYPSADNSKMPVVVLNTVPRIAEQLLNPQQMKQDGGFSDILHGRYVTLIVSVFTLLLVFRWARELYGDTAGLFAAFLLSICPNHLSNAGLVTTDAYSVLALLATFYFLWRFCLSEKRGDLLWLSLFVGLSQLVKQSLFHLYLLVPLCMGAYYVLNKKRWRLKQVLYGAGAFLFINWLIVNAGFYFYHTGEPLGQYRFMSSLFTSVRRLVPAWIPVPLPHPFVEGLDQAKYYDQVGGGYPHSSFGKVTILGQSRTGGSFWYYYLVALLFKTPLPFLIFFFWALGLRIKARAIFRSDVFFLLVPVSYYLILFSFSYNTQCGLRHLIFIYPFLFIFSSQVLLQLRSVAGKIAVAVLSVWAVASVLTYWKNYYPYTNELILNKAAAYQTVGAANLEFLQGGNFLKAYLQQHPNVKVAPKTPRQGTFAISLREYMDVWNQHEYDWISQYKPVGHIAYTYLLVKVD